MGANKLSHKDYLLEVEKMLDLLGGYTIVIEKTVQHYINQTGEWNLQGDDKYCKDAKLIAENILKQKNAL